MTSTRKDCGMGLLASRFQPLAIFTNGTHCSPHSAFFAEVRLACASGSVRIQSPRLGSGASYPVSECSNAGNDLERSLAVVV